MLLKFAQLLNDIRFEDLPESTVKQTKLLVLNFIGGALPGCDADIVMAERGMWDNFGGKPESSVLGQKGKLPAPAAAAVNAAMGQVFLAEDCHDPTASHPGVIIIPAALAVGQSLGSSGKEVIEAIVAGFEGMCRIGRCLALPGFSDHGLRTAAIIGPFGSCIAAAKLMKLDAVHLRNALAVAGNYAAGFMEHTIAGTSDICIQNCSASRNGILAAYEASHGMVGAPTILDGPFGLGMAFNQKACDWSLMTAPITHYEMDETFVKAYPSCGHVFPTAQAMEEICAQYTLRAEDIKHITVGTRRDGYYYPGCNNQGPFGGTISAMSSHQFVTASYIVNGGFSIPNIKNFGDSRIYELAQRIDLVVDDEVDAMAESGGRVTIELCNGQTITNLQEKTYGLPDDGVPRRLQENAIGYFTEDTVQKLIDLCKRMEDLDNICELADRIEKDA